MRTKTAKRTACRILLAATAAAASLALLAACTTTPDSPTATRTVTAAATTQSAQPSPGQRTAATAIGSSSPTSAPSTSQTSSTTRVDPDAPAGQCEDSALMVSLQYDPEAAGAGQRGAFVVLRNTGSSTCTLEGTPGLSLVGDGNGAQIGKPAERNTTGAKLVTLEPDSAALAQVQYTYIDKNGGSYRDGNGHNRSCQAKAADGYRVYPPHSYRAYFTPTKTYACSTDLHWISVGPVRPASDFKYFTPTT